MNYSNINSHYNLYKDFFSFIKFQNGMDLFEYTFNCPENISESKEKNPLISKKPKASLKPGIKMVSTRKTKRKVYKKLGKKTHNNESSDNMFKKVQGHYIKFIIDYINYILDILECEVHLCKINYNYITHISPKIFSNLKKSSIKEIINQRISPKIKNHPTNNNGIVLEKIKNNPIINELLSQSYIHLFKNVYYKSQRFINLNDYGLNINIILPKTVRMFKDLLEKKNNKQNPTYIAKLKDYVNKKFLIN